jgi:cold shock CspA family protein
VTMKTADALRLIDQTYRDKRRASLTMLLTAPGEPDVDAIEEQFAQQDAAFAEERARLVAWLKTLHEGGTMARVDPSTTAANVSLRERAAALKRENGRAGVRANLGAHRGHSGMTPCTGVVWRLLVGCGFLRADDDPNTDLFFAGANVVGARFADLRQGQRVSFVVVPNLRRPGSQQAQIVRPLDATRLT